MKNKILIMAIAAMNLGISINSYADDEKQLQVKLSDQPTSSSSFIKKIPQAVQNHPTMTLMGIACIFAGAHILSSHDLDPNKIYTYGYDNPIKIAYHLMMFGTGLLWYIFTRPNTQKTDNFIETTT